MATLYDKWRKRPFYLNTAGQHRALPDTFWQRAAKFGLQVLGGIVLGILLVILWLAWAE